MKRGRNYRRVLVTIIARSLNELVTTGSHRDIVNANAKRCLRLAVSEVTDNIKDRKAFEWDACHPLAHKMCFSSYQMSVPMLGILKWTSLNRYPVMVTSRGSGMELGPWRPCTVRSHFQIGGVQCIIGNGHTGPLWPCEQTHWQTHMKTWKHYLPTTSFVSGKYIRFRFRNRLVWTSS